MLAPLREAYEHYERLKVEEEKSRRGIDFNYHALSSTSVHDEDDKPPEEPNNEKNLKKSENNKTMPTRFWFLNTSEDNNVSMLTTTNYFIGWPGWPSG